LTKVILKWLGLLVLVLIAASMVAVVSGLSLRHMGQKTNADIGGIVAPNGIDEAGYMTIGGVHQWVTVRGQDKSQPILLFLHGGPGGALADESYMFQRPWEDYFTVVQWDQRGFGRSDVDKAKIKGTVTNARYVDDAIDLIEQLKTRLKQPKVIVIGQSWGSILGLEVAHQRPDLLYALVTIGQVVSWEGNFEETRRLLTELARKTGDQALLKKMTDVGPVPPPADYERFNKWSKIVQGEMTNRGYSWHNSSGSWGGRMITAAIFSPGVTDTALVSALIPKSHQKAYIAQVLGSLAGWKAETDVGTRLDVPWVVMQGDWDWQTPTTAARAYFAKVCAPWKMWVSFHNSAHVVTAEEPGKTIVSLVNYVLPTVRGEVPPGAETCGQ
jgi:pimeloyl-ACP methyl ester carboxylesterase